MKSKILQELLDKMDKDPWYIKLRRWFHVKIWIWKCNTRFIWDLEYQHNIFKMKIKLCNSYKRKRKIVCKRKIKEANDYITNNPYGKLYSKMAYNFFYYSNRLRKL